MIDPGALGTLRIGLDAIDAESHTHRRRQSVAAPRRERAGIRVVLATGLRRVASALERTEGQRGRQPMTQVMTASRLQVPGAAIHYETRGTGPLLLIIPGGPQDAGVFVDLATRLADRYTVVAYDPRGNSRSVVDGEPGTLDLDVQGDDAAALIRALGAGPAAVFGTSGGAQIGLNLAARYPDLVTVLVAHEPPVIMLLDDPSAALAADQEIHDTYRREGVDAAMQRFFALNGLEDDEDHGDASPAFAPTPEEAATFERVSGNFEYWLAHGMIPLSVYRPDVEALRAGPPRIVVGVGEQSAGQMIHDMSMALAAAARHRTGGLPGRPHGL